MNKHIALALALATAPFAASASELGYSYIEAGYARADIDVHGLGDADFDGFQIRGSAEVGDSVYLFGGYGSTRNDDFGVDIDFSELQLGVGYHRAIGARADVLAELGYVREALDAEDVGSGDASGGRVSVGIRGAFSEHVEGFVKGSYNDGGDFEGTFSGMIGAEVKFNPTWGVYGEIETGELGDEADVSKYGVGVRASF